ncbi:AAA-like domain-containing protein [Iningainema tapete]|uniref:AAA-like domain-containing protein n=1 Tax=Iningainema tapete BLCC-T55 TaxID=2748662 RepID=A0A8J6XTS4_9CYAN|nr:AAA-like domain-containing protein [Iningainema tapete]MBD2773728.1 AAA-like domain-containing protein [Iningainema tapete BLCC-T55]
MSIDEVVLLLKANLPNALTPLQEMVLRSSWEGKTYTNIAVEAHYGEERVRKVASSLWQLLSDFWQEPINKSNFRASLELRRLSRAQQQLIREFNRTATAISLEFPNGPVSLDSKFYIPRPPVEELVYAQIAEQRCVICIKAPKKMGKSSLIIRILAHAATLGYSTVSLDFQQADKAVFANLDKFLRWFCANVSRELKLEPKLNDYWDEEMGSKISCSLYFQEYLLPALQSPVVLALNELDWVFEHPDIAADFLPMLRSWYEQATRVDNWQKLRLVMAYSTEILVPLRLTQSPFNIGLPIKLPPFTKQQVEDLAERHGLNWADGSEADKLMAMVGGHPYLVRLALYHLVGKGGLERDLGRLLQQAPLEAGIYQEHLRQYVLALQSQPELRSGFYQVVTATSPVKLEPVLAYKLQSMGLVNLVGKSASPACELYRLYFREQLNTQQQIDSTRVEQLENENQQLRILSHLDELTQLANRRYFNTYLQKLWDAGSHRFLSLILCDIDYFKIYNKTYGETAGDDCLRQIANAIRNVVRRTLSNNSFYTNNEVTNVKYERSSVLAARYGPEEFAILTQQDATVALQMAENIREQVKALAIECDYPGIDGLPANVLTVSVGVACIIPEPQTEPTILINAAEKALYQAKRRGRDRVVLN